MEKIRADLRLVELNKDLSREKAKKLIMAGSVLEGTRRIEKPGELLEKNAILTVKEGLKYVSRGGYKLEKIIESFNIDLLDKTCLDIGASTGGFTDCMLQHGAKKVYAIDVGYGQLDYSLRIHPKVQSMERTNIRTFDPKNIEDDIDFISIDVSFISLKLVLPVAKAICRPNGLICALIKPQFEAGRNQVGKKGVIRDKKVHQEVLESMWGFIKELNINPLAFTYSPIKGTTGNLEFLMLLRNENFENNNIPDFASLVKEGENAK